MSKSTQKPLRLNRVKLVNWRNFVELDVQLQSRAFLVGPNASGKSNFLDVFRFLHDLVSVGGGLEQAVRVRGGMTNLRSLSGRRDPHIMVRVSIGGDSKSPDWEYELRFREDHFRKPLVTYERVVRRGVEILVRPTKKDARDREGLTQTYLEQVQANRKFRDVARFFSSIRYLHIVPQLVREPERSIGKTNDPYGGDFLDQIARTPQRTRAARLRRIRDALQAAVPQLQDLDLERDRSGTPHLRGSYDYSRSQYAWQSENQFSDGTLRLIGLLWALLDGDGPLLLEEPELSLHPEVVRFIPQMFARMQHRARRQVLVSTHSPELLRDEGIGLNEVLLFKPGADGTSVKPATSLRDAQQLLDGGLSLAEVVIPNTAPTRASRIFLLGEGR